MLSCLHDDNDDNDNNDDDNTTTNNKTARANKIENRKSNRKTANEF